jgi:hypothetical protein
MTVQLRAALYLRVSTARQAEHDASIPDQRRQGESYSTSSASGWSRPMLGTQMVATIATAFDPHALAGRRCEFA